MKLLFTKHGGWLVFSAVVFYIIIFTLIGLWKYYNFGYDAMDLAIINQVFYNSSLGDFFGSSIHPPTYLGDHFTPILFLLLPFYYLFRRPESLLILQTLFLAAGAWPVYLIAQKALNKNWGVVLALGWLANPFVQNINLFEFHFLPLAVFFIFWTFYFYQQEKFLPFIIFGGLALLVREDVALVISMFGVIAILDRRKLKWWLTPIILSIIYFILAIKISSLFSPTSQYKFLLYYSWLGNSWPEIIKNIILHPWWLVPKIFSPGGLIVGLALLLPTVYLPLLKPKYLLLSALIYVQLVIGVSWNWLATVLFTQYSALLLPGLFIAAIFGLKKMSSQPLKNKVLGFLLSEKTLLLIIALATVIYSTVALGPLAGSGKEIITKGIIWPETKIKNELMAKIPPTAAVAATYEFLAPLSFRQNIASLNYAFLGKQQFSAADYSLPEQTEYLIINFTDLITYQLQYGTHPLYQEQYQQARADWQKILADFGLIEIKDTLALYQKGVEDEFALIKTWDNQPEITEQHNTILNPDIEFLGFNKLDNQYQLFWRLSLPLAEEYQLELALTEQNKIVQQKIYSFGYGLLYSEKNSGEKIVQTNYWFGDNQAIPVGSYDLAISLIEIKSGGIELNSVRGTENIIDIKNKIGVKIPLGQITFSGNDNQD